jgi:hypothetical protein
MWSSSSLSLQAEEVALLCGHNDSYCSDCEVQHRRRDDVSRCWCREQ